MTFSLKLVGVATLAGFLTIAILMLALFAGLWLDDYFTSENHIYTIALLCVSVPFTLVAMLWVVRFTTARLLPANSSKDEEDAASG
ncbi:MAG: hypothetical protein KIS85_03645 [Anaerolineales bacterium]|nr:hypothetical protein [Anaerolineales bacterium]